MSTLDLINAIEAGDATGVEAAFNDVMTAKISDKLDTMRNDMAQTMFKGVPETEENDFDPETEITNSSEQETVTTDNE